MRFECALAQFAAQHATRGDTRGKGGKNGHLDICGHLGH